MSDELSGTKLALIQAAGELFAEHGVEGTSIRAIADKAGANIAAINYHFGGKENLYTETLRHLVLQNKGKRPSSYLEEEKWFSTPEMTARMIQHIMRDAFASYYSPNKPPWYGKLIARSLLKPSRSLETVIKEVIQPDNEAIKEILRRTGRSEAEAQLWAFTIFAQVSFYGFAEVLVLTLLQKDTYDTEFINATADHTAGMIIAALGLPQVKD